jgi:flagellar basal body-associated protein FliL
MAEAIAATLEADEQQSAPPRRGGTKRYYVALLVGGIMAAEGLLGWWVLANRSSGASAPGSGTGAEGEAPAVSKADAPPAVREVEPKDLDLKEVEIGDFQLTNYSRTGSTMHLQIHFTATIDKQGEGEFTKLFEQHKFRIRQRILSILRSSTEEDLTEPSLDLIRRKIQDHLNKLLESKLILNVYFTDAHVMPQ